MANIPLLPSGVANANVYNVLPSYLMGFIKNAVSHMRVWVTCVVSCAIILHTVMRFLSELQQVYKLAQSRVISDIEKKSLRMENVADRLIQQIETKEEEEKNKAHATNLVDGVSAKPTAHVHHLNNMSKVMSILNNYVYGKDQDELQCFKWMCDIIEDIRQQEQSGKCSAGIQARNEKVVNNILGLLDEQGDSLYEMMEIGKFGCIAVCSRSNIQTAQNRLVEDSK